MKIGARRAFGWIRAHPWKTLGLVAGTYLLAEVVTIPWFGIARLRTENPGRTALMEQRIGEAEDRGQPYTLQQRWIPLSRIPRHVVMAVIVAEDGAFYDHGGIDWFEVQESLERNVKERRVARGASTITQQLAKNLYLSTSRTPMRKAKEVAITLLLEGKLSKSRILELYLNVIEWGKGIFGIEAASRAYFGKPASALSVEEGARLAAVIPSPLRHRPDEASRYVLRRTRIVLARLSARRGAVEQTPKQIEEESPNRSGEETSPPVPAPEVPEADSLETAEDQEPNGL